MTTRITTRPCSFRNAEMLRQGGIHPVLARIYASRGQATRAIQELEQALSIEPGDPVSAGMLGKLRALN